MKYKRYLQKMDSAKRKVKIKIEKVDVDTKPSL